MNEMIGDSVPERQRCYQIAVITLSKVRRQGDQEERTDMPSRYSNHGDGN